MKFFKELFKIKSKNNDLKPQRFSFSAAFFGILVPIYRKDFRWFSIYFFVLFFLSMMRVMGFTLGFVVFLLLIWNSVFACYYNTWSPKEDFWLDHMYEEKKRKKTSPPGPLEDSRLFIALRKRFDRVLRIYIEFRKAPPLGRDFHLRNIVIIFSLTSFYYLLSALFLEDLMRAIPSTSAPITLRQDSEETARDIHSYLTLISREMKYINKLERKRGDLLQKENSSYSLSSYDKDLKFIESRLSYQRTIATPPGLEGFNKDLQDIYTTYRKFLNHQYLYLSSKSKKDKTLAVNYRHSFFQKEDRFLSQIEQRLSK